MTPHTYAELEHAEVLLDRDPAEAIRRIAAVLADNPDNVDALCLLARGQVALGRAGDALPAAARAARLAPDEAYVQYVLSGVLSQLGRHDEAIAAAGLSVRLEPHNPLRHDRVTGALLAADTRLTDALDSARTALALDPETADFHVSYAMVAARLGRRGDARKALLHALLLDPQHAAARHELTGRLSPVARQHLRPVVTSGGRWRAVLTAVMEANNRLRAAGVEVPYVLGAVTLTVVAAGCAVLATKCLAAGEPALTVAGGALAAGGLYAVFAMLNRRKIRD